jgi:predicted  nucleic acid-binding Zn-ribbon protein
MEMPLDKVRKVLKIAKEPISLETPIGEEEDSTWATSSRTSPWCRPVESVIGTNLEDQTRKVLKTLTPREEKVLRMRFGIGEKSDHTLEEVGQDFEVTRERIRQIEAKALRKLRHPSRSKQLRSFMENSGSRHGNNVGGWRRQRSVREQLRALAKLSVIDAAAREFEDELRQIPQQIDEMRADVKRLEGLLVKEREQLAEAEALKRAQEQEVADRNEAISRAKAKGAKSRTPKEADAAEREVEANRRAVREREDEVLRLDEVIEKLRAHVEQHQNELEEFRQEFVQEEQKGQERVAELEAERGKVLSGRDEAAGSIPRPLLSRYERLQQRLGSGVAIVSDERCTVCSMALPAQQFIQVQRGEEIEQCPNCLRILLYKPLIED